MQFENNALRIKQWSSARVFVLMGRQNEQQRKHFDKMVFKNGINALIILLLYFRYFFTINLWHKSCIRANLSFRNYLFICLIDRKKKCFTF